jgi:hypothetical protein
MTTPLFNYSSQLLAQVAQAGILFSSESILSLNCINTSKSIKQQHALENFEHWKLIFLDNCDAVFYTAPRGQITVYESKYKADILSALLVAELFDWDKYESIEQLNTSSIVKWVDGSLCKSRMLINLI